jgi:hypothetical protein
MTLFLRVRLLAPSLAGLIYSLVVTKLSALRMPAKREFAIGQPGLVIVAINHVCEKASLRKYPFYRQVEHMINGFTRSNDNRTAIRKVFYRFWQYIKIFLT